MSGYSTPLGKGKVSPSKAHFKDLRCRSWSNLVGGQTAVTAHTLCWGNGPASLINSRFSGQAGQESHRQPAVLETQSGVSRGVGHYRHVSAVTGAPTGGNLCFRGRTSPCSAYPIRGRNRRTYGLIWRLLLAEPMRSARPIEPRLLRWKRL